MTAAASDRDAARDSRDPVLIKVCGVTRADDVRMCVDQGVDWLGINCWPRSRRFVEPDHGAKLAAIIRASRPAPTVVGVFVDQPVDEVLRTAEVIGLKVIQLHGGESAAMCERVAAAGYRVIKALGLSNANDAARLAAYPCATVLADTPTIGYGGSGRTFDWQLARDPALASKRVILAGGLHAGNVAQAIAATDPYAVDTASGVESAPGCKDADRVAAFVAAVRTASRR